MSGLSGLGRNVVYLSAKEKECALYDYALRKAGKKTKEQGAFFDILLICSRRNARSMKRRHLNRIIEICEKFI